MMNPAELLALWDALTPPATNKELEALEIVPGSGVWVARDNASQPHLLILVGEEGDLPTDEMHGLAAAIKRHRVAGREDAPYLDLACLDQAVFQTFAAVATNLAEAVVVEPIDSRLSVATALIREWRWFWGVDKGHMSLADAIGLFGELWFLIRWAGVKAASVTAWEGSNGSRHDFQWETTSVEVKTTSAGEPVVHSINHLEQLEDPVSGDLYLFSVRIARDALAANSVVSLASTAIEALNHDAVARSELLSKLARRGFTPVGSDMSQATYRVLSEQLYRVTDGFPRLVPQTFADGLPPGVTDISYRLDMGACDVWRVETTPETWSP